MVKVHLNLRESEYSGEKNATFAAKTEHKIKICMLSIFRKFKLKGNRPFLRTDEEMKSIDKKEADKAFKLYKKEHIDTLLKSKGFIKYSTTTYVRRNQVDVLEFIELQKETHGSKTFTVNYAMTPLYVPHNFLSLDFCERIGMLLCKRDIWWDFANDSIAKVRFGNVAKAIEEFVIPWFDSHSNNDSIRELLNEEKKTRENKGDRLSDLQQAWLDAIDDYTDCQDVIMGNIALFALPQKLYYP